MFHGEGCLNNVLHFLIVTVCLRFHSMTGITSWCLNVIIKVFLVSVGITLVNLKKLKCLSVNTIDTAVCVARLFPYSTKITSFKVDEEEEEKEEEEEEKKEKAEEMEEKEEEKEEKEYIFCIKDWLQASYMIVCVSYIFLDL